MSTSSQFCIQQRHKEQQRLKKFLIFGFTGSVLLHGILAYVLPLWSLEAPTKSAAEPIELILVDKPKPKPKNKPKPIPKPKSVVAPEPEPIPEPKSVVAPEPEPIPEPKPIPSLEPVVKPEPAKAQTPPIMPEVKPIPKPQQVLTTPTPAPTQPVIPTPVKAPAQPSPPKKAITPSVTETPSESSSPNTRESVATNSAPSTPEASSPKEEISCVGNCEPEYPSDLEGAEGSAGIKLTIDPNGNVIGAELALPNSNSLVNRQALLAARQMEFSSPGENSASVQVKIDFTVEGSEYDRLAREEQKRREQADKEKQELEAVERQQELEAERRAQQEQLEKARQTRQQELKEDKQPDTQLETKPLPSLNQDEIEEERLRKFRERIENYQ